MLVLERITRAAGRTILDERYALTAHHRQTHPERSKTACEGVCEPYRTATKADSEQTALDDARPSVTDSLK